MGEWLLVCEVLPGVLRRLQASSLRDAKHYACLLAEHYYGLYNSSQYIVVKDCDYNGYWAVRYSPENGGTYHVPEEYQA